MLPSNETNEQFEDEDFIEDEYDEFDDEDDEDDEDYEDDEDDEDDEFDEPYDSPDYIGDF